VIQYIYDSHYEGAAEAAELGNEWATLKGHIDDRLYEDVRARLEYQAGHAIVWRDAIAQYFLKQSGIPDEQRRAGHYPGRLEAEDARLTGYHVIDVTPWEDASGGKAVICGDLPPIPAHLGPTNAAPLASSAEVPPHEPCSAEWTYAGQTGRYNIAIQYFDLPGGVAKFALTVNNQPAATWSADAKLPSWRPNGDNSTRYTVPNIDLKPGDVLRVEGAPDKNDPAALDYIEIAPGH
jgi:alpha-glucuronidase